MVYEFIYLYVFVWIHLCILLSPLSISLDALLGVRLTVYFRVTGSIHQNEEQI